VKYLVKARPSPAMVVALVALFVALSGTAVALNGSNTVQSDDLGPGAQVQGPDVAANAINSSDVVNESLTGADIKNKSGVDACVSGARLGQLCVRAENFDRPWIDAANHCANLDMRMPSLAEALELAKTHDIPNVDDNELFWTGNRYISTGGGFVADLSDDFGHAGYASWDSEFETVCVTTPTN
jgi:hypothetical protein